MAPIDNVCSGQCCVESQQQAAQAAVSSFVRALTDVRWAFLALTCGPLLLCAVALRWLKPTTPRPSHP